jgi:hypothetical protein
MNKIKQQNMQTKMKKTIILFALLLSISAYSNAQENQKNLTVTIYNDDLGVVKDAREINLKKGINTVRIQNVASQIDLTSVLIKLPNAKVIEQNFQYDLINPQKILEKYIDKEIIINTKENTISGILLAAHGNFLTIKQNDNSIILLNSDDAKITFPAAPALDNLMTKPTLVWTVEADKDEKQTAEFTYQTSGMSWNAVYVAELNDDETKMDLNAWVTINNFSGATYSDAQLKLIAGKVNRVKEEIMPFAANRMMLSDGYAMRGASTSENFFETEDTDFFEYHLYELKRKTTLHQNETKQISLFTVEDIDVKKNLGVKTFLTRAGKLPVNIIIDFKNSEANGLGIPLPEGKIRVNKNDGKHIEFVGEDLIKHTPKNENLKLAIGETSNASFEATVVNDRRLGGLLSS